MTIEINLNKLHAIFAQFFSNQCIECEKNGFEVETKQVTICQQIIYQLAASSGCNRTSRMILMKRRLGNMMYWPNRRDKGKLLQFSH